MIQRAYTIFDIKALQYYPPFFASTDGAAVRNVKDLVNDMNTQVGRHPADFQLFCIGTYDDSNAHFEPLHPLKHVVDAVALVTIAPPLPFGLTPSHDELKANGAA